MRPSAVIATEIFLPGLRLIKSASPVVANICHFIYGGLA
jgi:hypothetical protein